MHDTKMAAVAYYTALGKKAMEAVKACLHPEVYFTDPKETVVGREAVLEAAAGFSTIFDTLTIRAAWGSEDDALVVYDVAIPGLAAPLRAASWLHFRDGLIASIELTYDTGVFKKQKEEAPLSP